MTGSDDLARIISGCKRRDAQCFAEVVNRYSSRCYGYYYRLTGNRDVCDELLSELFLRLVEKIGSYKGGSFDSWVFRIASNIFHDHLRGKQRRRRLYEGHAEQVQSEITEAKKSDEEKFDKLQRQLERLDPDMRELIMLRFYGELSFKEMAQIRREPIGTTLSKLHRGLKKLRELME